MLTRTVSRRPFPGAPSVGKPVGVSRPGQGRCGMASLLAALLLLIAVPAFAQSSQGLFWQCSTQGGQPTYCPVNNTYPLPSSNAAAASGGGSVFRSVTLTNTAVAVDASPGTVSMIHAANTGGSAALCYLQLYDVAAASVTVGTTTPTITLAIAASTVLTLPLSTPIQFATAISAAATTTAGGSTACSPILQSTVIEYK